MTRRYFLGLWNVLAAALATAAAVPPLVHWWRSKGPEGGGGESWVDLGQARKVPEGRWLRKEIAFERRNRWRRESARELVYVRRDAREFRIFTAVCPHSGCLVRLDQEGFSCPCHRSFFDGTGRAATGPSPRGLDLLEWKVEKKRLKVRYQRFRSGTAEREALAG